MTDFRTQLDHAKTDYQSAKFPGDLASLVLPTPLYRRPIVWRIGVPLAAAASVAIAFGVFWPRTGGTPVVPVTLIPEKTFVAVNDGTLITPPTTPAVAAMPATDSMPESLSFPTELPVMPTGDSVSSFPSSPTMPGITSFTDTTVSEKEPT